MVFLVKMKPIPSPLKRVRGRGSNLKHKQIFESNNNKYIKLIVIIYKGIHSENLLRENTPSVYPKNIRKREVNLHSLSNKIRSFAKGFNREPDFGIRISEFGLITRKTGSGISETIINPLILGDFLLRTFLYIQSCVFSFIRRAVRSLIRKCWAICNSLWTVPRDGPSSASRGSARRRTIT